MRSIFIFLLTLSAVMAAVDPRSQWCLARCMSLHETDCPDEDECPETDSQSDEYDDYDADDTSDDKHVCVSPCDEFKETCTSSCWDAYDTCKTRWLCLLRRPACKCRQMQMEFMGGQTECNGCSTTVTEEQG